VRVKVAYFGMPVDLTPTDDEVLEIPAGSTLRDLVSKLEAEHPSLTEMASKMEVLLGGMQGDAGATLKDGDEVDFMPPVGGG
jgi:molybdopterin converting factor small subunit